MSSDLVSEKWSRLDPEGARNFFGFEPLRDYQIRSALGDAAVPRYHAQPGWTIDSFVDEFCVEKPPRKILSLCCGFGGLDRYILERLPNATLLGVDLADGAIAAARERAAAAGLASRLRYEVTDLNNWKFQPAEFDLVLAGGALHHLASLERVIDGIWESLTDGGFLFANEFIGASYLDHSPRELELINAVAYLLPLRFRGRRPTLFRHRHKFLNAIAGFSLQTWRRLRTLADPNLHPEWSPRKRQAARLLRFVPGFGAAKPEHYLEFGLIHDSLKHHLLKTDPSECVRSAEIIPLLQQRFPSLIVRAYGGATLLHALDWEFYDKFDPQSDDDIRLLHHLCDLELHYLSTGEIKPEVAMMIGRKPGRV